MLIKLYKLANKLDKTGNTSIADEIDVIIKSAIELTPEKERQIEESIDKYYADPEIQEKNQIERDYGLGVFSDDEDDLGGLEPKPWHGHRWSYEGFPKGADEYFKKFERYQTVIGNDSNLPEKINDPAEGGVWVRENVFDRPNSLSKNDEFQTVYRFVDTAKEQRKKEIWGDDDVVEDLKGSSNWDTYSCGDCPEEFSSLEKLNEHRGNEQHYSSTGKDVVEVEENPSGVGGVKLF